ncbi:MAG: T9SS type A sorting domain-containing protein [FCB group bacterium]
MDDTLTNFTTKIIKVVKSGKYNVGVVQNGCASNWSAPYQFTSTGVKELDKKGTTSVFPNPALDFITISGYAGTAIIYDIIGKEVWRGNFGAKENINISKLQTGLYYIKINNHNQFNFIKFFKQ